MRLVLEKCFIAGWDHGDGNSALTEGMAAPSDCTLGREPTNNFDANAIMVLWRGWKLGYIPKDRNGALALLMDEGRKASAKIVELNPASSNPWKKCAINVEVGQP